MYSRILIPLDGSPVAEQVLPWAKWMAEGLHSVVILFQAVSEAALPAGEISQAASLEAREYMQSVARDFARTEIRTECVVRAGPPAPTVVDFAEHERIGLIAMATHGRTGLQRWVYGNVADKVLHGTHLPLLLVRVSAHPARFVGMKRILVPLDGSRLAEQVLPHAEHLAMKFDAEILLFGVWEEWGYRLGMYPGTDLEQRMQAVHALARNYLLDTAHALQAKGLRARWALQTGLAADCILEAAAANGVHLVAMSTHGRSGIDRWVMGSVADRVLRASPVPVLLVRPAGALRTLDEPALRLQPGPTL